MEMKQIHDKQAYKQTTNTSKIDIELLTSEWQISPERSVIIANLFDGCSLTKIIKH